MYGRDSRPITERGRPDWTAEVIFHKPLFGKEGVQGQSKLFCEDT